MSVQTESCLDLQPYHPVGWDGPGSDSNWHSFSRYQQICFLYGKVTLKKSDLTYKINATNV